MKFDASELKAKIEANSIPVTDSGCWIWMKAVRSNDGYGCINLKKKSKIAHRISWMAYRGEIPLGMMVCHHCDVRLCVNPDHLFVGTNTDNMADCRAKRRTCHGVKKPWAKLDVQQVLFIRRSAVAATALARQFGVSERAVRDARSGKNWKYV